jgi:hypothetical protein
MNLPPSALPTPDLKKQQLERMKQRTWFLKSNLGRGRRVSASGIGKVLEIDPGDFAALLKVVVLNKYGSGGQAR